MADSKQGDPNLFPWQQSGEYPPILPKRAPPARNYASDGEIYGRTGSRDVPVDLQRSLGYGADVKVKARPVPGPPQAGALPWSEAMQARAQGSTGDIPVAPAVQQKVKAPPKTRPTTDPYFPFKVVRKKMDPSLISVADVANAYEIGLMEQHSYAPEVARRLTVERFNEGLFHFAPDKMELCKLIEWLPMTVDEKVVARYTKFPQKVSVDEDPTAMTEAQRKEIYQVQLQASAEITDSQADLVCETLRVSGMFSDAAFGKYLTGPWSPRSRAFAPPQDGYTFEAAEDGLQSVPENGARDQQDPLQQDDPWPAKQPEAPPDAPASSSRQTAPLDRSLDAQYSSDADQSWGPGKQTGAWGNEKWQKSGWGSHSKDASGGKDSSAGWSAEDQQKYEQRIQEENEYHTRAHGKALKQTWKPAPDSLPMYIHARFGMVSVITNGRSASTWRRTLQYVDTRDKRITSSFGGQHPIISWVNRDRNKNANNVQEARTQLNDGFHGYLQVSSVTATDHVSFTFIWSYLHSVPVPHMSTAVLEALSHDDFKEIHIPRVYQQTGSVVIIQVVVRIGGEGYPAEVQEEWMVLCRFQWKSNDGDMDMDLKEIHIDDYVARQFVPPAQRDGPNAQNRTQWDTGRSPSYKIVVLVLKGDGRVGACVVHNQGLLWVLKDQPGKLEPEVCALGKPYFIAEVQVVGKGSQDGVDGLPRFEMSIEDFTNQIIQKSDRTMVPPSYLIVKGLKQTGLIDAVRYLRGLKIPPQILSPDQVLQPPQLARLHEWWIAGLRGENMDDPRLEYVVGYSSEDVATVHSLLAMGQQFQAPVSTNNVRALGDMEVAAKDTRPARLNIAGPQKSDLMVVFQELKMLNMDHLWRNHVDSLPDLKDVRYAAQIMNDRQLSDRASSSNDIPAPENRPSKGGLGGDQVQAQFNADALARNVRVTNLAEVREFQVGTEIESDAASDRAVAGAFYDAQVQDELHAKVRAIIDDHAVQDQNQVWNGADDNEIS